jgi:ribose transport system ATP-binding protein
MSAVAPPGDTHVARAPALAVTTISKTFPGQRALDGVDIDVARGEIHALVGQNGCGKSTLVKILAGYHDADPGGHVQVAGKATDLGTPAAAHAAGMRFVHQDLGLIAALPVSDNFRLGIRERRSAAPLDRSNERRRVVEGLKSFGYDINPRAMVASLSESERTAVALVRALDGWEHDCHLIVLDEVTAAMPGPEAARLFESLRRIADSGVAVLFVSHHLDEVLRVADRVTVLRDGCLVVTADVNDLTHDRLVELMLGRELLEDVTQHVRSHEGQRTEALLQVSGLRGETVAGIDLEVRAGEVLGIVGLTGSGREEVAGLLAGRLPRAGTVKVGGRTLPPGQPSAAISAGLCCVPADRARQALLPIGSVRENMTVSDLSKFWRRGYLSPRQERREVKQWVDELTIAPGKTEIAITQLSGGNQQKVVMSRWLRVSPKVLVLDEPTQGVDVGSKADVHRLVDLAVDNGAAAVVCSTDSDELARLSTRVMVMHRGLVVATLEGDDVTPDRIDERQLLADRRTAPETPTTERTST